MDFSKQFDCYVAAQIDETFRRYCGYAAVSIVDVAEASAKIGAKQAFLVVDSESSGAICQPISGELSYS
jgi:hypothetical protein